MEDHRTHRVPDKALTVNNGVAKEQIEVDAARLKQWAEEVVEEWLPGYTSYDKTDNLQYQVDLLGSESGDTEYRVSLGKGYGNGQQPRRFSVTVVVKELR